MSEPGVLRPVAKRRGTPVFYILRRTLIVSDSECLVHCLRFPELVAHKEINASRIPSLKSDGVIA